MNSLILLIKRINVATIDMSLYSCEISMDKKAYIVAILQKLQPYRPMAEGILALMESGYADDSTIDGILNLLHQGVKQIATEKGKEKFQKAIELVQKIKHQEEDERIGEKQDLDALLDTI